MTKKKHLIETATLAAVAAFTLKAAAHGVIGWLAVKVVKRAWEWLRRKWHGRRPDPGVPPQEPPAAA